ncbi:MAG: putative toxin-antitoxin system toxin component, PIN family [Propionivibrio sp.]
MRLVLDTNIVIDLLHFADRHAQPLAAGLRSGRLQCFSDGACVAELERVAGYPEFGLDVVAQTALLRRYGELVTICEADHDEDYRLPRCRDADDQKFLVLAARCRADLLITRDKELLRLARQRSSAASLPFSILTAAAAAPLLRAAAENPAGAV